MAFQTVMTIAKSDARKILRVVTMDFIPILLFCASVVITVKSTEVDTINTTQSIRDGEFLLSGGASFKLGFFSPGSSKNRYLGIWYNRISVMTVVWVANREIPIPESSGALKVTDQGILILLSQNGRIIWSTNSSRSVTNPVAQLLDTGNLIVKEEGDNNLENVLWQSFDYPCDTILPGMKLGKNIVTGFDRYLSSWKTPDDPGRGKFTSALDSVGYPEFILREDSTALYRSGPWNGQGFSGLPPLKPNPIYSYDFVINEKEIYYVYQLLNSSILSRAVLNHNGEIQRLVWIDRTRGWVLYLTAQIDNCDSYGLCGAYGSCNNNKSPMCNCLKGFVPKIPKDWNRVDWSSGCVRQTLLNCSEYGFRKYSGLKLPETRKSWFNKSITLEQCKNMCMKNCSCTAYANLDIRAGGSGCLLWFDELIDIRELAENEQDIYIRIAASELDHEVAMKKTDKFKAQRRTRIIVSSVLSSGFVLLGLALFLYILRKKQQTHSTRGRSLINKYEKEDMELPLFDLGTMVFATDNFSDTKKLGEGGFGPVYEGSLKDGQEIAVKRLSKNSTQGLDEFKNEVMHIVNLQHRNLVKLLGCCIEADEKMLIYEFMPNKSLDFFIFDQAQSTQLDWPKRYNVINGIARGLLYLHQDSRLRIIHRDLKASNVLLDYEMNPKISDFGLARSVRGNESDAQKSKVVGTYGYISPEYANDGLYSAKSDVFSFGVLVLEIVSGKRNSGFCHPEHNLNLLGHAWKLFAEGRSSELISSSIVESCNLSEVLRSIHVGLLCVQCSPKDRPSMASVVLMLGSGGELSQPKQPGFFSERDFVETNYSSSQSKLCSANDFTTSIVEARWRNFRTLTGCQSSGLVSNS